MSETPASLLERLRTRPDERSWKRLVDLYTPLIHGWLRRYGVKPADADDLTQEVLTVVVRELPQFEHDQRRGAFRCWLRAITIHRLRGFWRASRYRPAATGDSAVEEQLRQLEDPNSDLSRRWDEEHDQFVLRRLLELIEPDFAPNWWQAFRRVALKGEAAAAVAADLGMTVNAVLLAKSRVLRRLREEARGLVD
jgi:RNA polymerase sigma-70 factor (ECF subfamily)